MNLPLVGWPAADQDRTPRGWSWPQPLIPPRVEGWPRGQNRSTDPARRLLAEAVGYWDSSAHRTGDRRWLNLGSSGEPLDLLLGGNPSVPTSNDPLHLAPEEEAFVYLPGSSGAFLSVNNSAALAIYGDITLAGEVTPDIVASGATQAIVAKRAAAGRSYQLNITTGGGLSLQWSTNGTSDTNGESSTAALPYPPGARFFVAATLDADNGAGGYTVRFWYSIDGINWTKLGADVVGGSTTSIAASVVVLAVGANSDGGSPFAGKVHRAWVTDGIGAGGVPGGTKVLDIDTSVLISGSSTSFAERSSGAATVTVIRPAAGRKPVVMPSKGNGGRAAFLLGSDDYFECHGAAQDALLNFDRGDSFTALVWVRQWPNPTSYGRYLSKRDYTAAQGAWDVTTDAATFGVLSYLRDRGAGMQQVLGTFSAGVPTMLSAVVDRGFDGLRVGLGTSQSIAASTRNLGSLANPFPFRIGRSGGPGGYQDFELFRAAIFRRVLNTRELASLATL